MIIEGVVKVVGRDADMQKIDVCEFGAGAIFGEMEFLHDHDTVADVGSIWTLRFRLGVRAGVRVQSKQQGWTCRGVTAQANKVGCRARAVGVCFRGSVDLSRWHPASQIQI